MNKFMKMAVVVGMLMAVTGCASVGGVANKMVDNQVAGEIYGMGGVDKTSAKQFCEMIGNKDPRCASPENYVVVNVFARFAYSGGAIGVQAFVPRDFKGLDVLSKTHSTGDSDAPFVRARVIPGQFGEVLEVVSTHEDKNVCYWSGMPRAGGTVCPKYGYDYRTDFIGVHSR